MKSIDMAIRIKESPGLLYERLSARTEAGLQDLVKQKCIEWGKNGVFSTWPSRSFPAVYYPSSQIVAIRPYSVESFGYDEIYAGPPEAIDKA
jgi:hypothetical protein